MSDPTDSVAIGPAPFRIDSETFLRDHCQLPPLPAVVNTILDELRQGDANATRVADILETDPALVAHVLKVVNSAYYGLSNRISQVSHAVAYLGLGEIERLLLTVSAIKAFPISTSKEIRDVWLHSFHSAITAKYVAGTHIATIDWTELHTTVLLHDVGKLVYLTFFAEHYHRLEELARAESVLIVEAERVLDYPSHCRMGALLCDRWKLPETVRVVCERHEPEHLSKLDTADPHSEKIRFVALVNLLCNLATRSFRAESLAEMRGLACSALDLDEVDLSVLVGEVGEMKAEAEGFLQQLSGVS